MFAFVQRTTLAALTAVSLLSMAGASQAATFNPINNITSGGTYDISSGPYAFGVFFAARDDATTYTFDFVNNSASSTTVGLTTGTVLQDFSRALRGYFLNGFTAAWANGDSFYAAPGEKATFDIQTVLAPLAKDTLTLSFSDPRGSAFPGVQLNVAALAAVPLPAGGLLLLAALGSIAALRRRKAV